MFTKKQVDIVRRLENFSQIYAHYALEGEKPKKEQFEEDNNYLALLLFIKYAYERNIDLTNYRTCALDTLEQYRKKINWTKSLYHKAVEDIWKTYQEIAKKKYEGLKVNEKNNPMNSKEGVLNRLSEESIINLTKYARKKLIEQNTQEIYDFICSIRGVKYKIASFYLRDLAFFLEIDENQIKDLYLLQPIDIWLERVGKILFKEWKPISYSKKVIVEKQKKILTLCKQAEVSSISFNQGTWEFGARIAKSERKFEKALNNEDYMEDLVKYRKDELRDEITRYEEWMKDNENYLNLLQKRN